jgi:nucleotide-binding universal stress UspA family protein
MQRPAASARRASAPSRRAPARSVRSGSTSIREAGARLVTPRGTARRARPTRQATLPSRTTTRGKAKSAPSPSRPRAASRARPQPTSQRTTPVIVLGVDFSPATDAALESAIRMAHDVGGRIVLVHAIPPLGSPGLDPAHPARASLRNESADLAAAIDANPAERLQRLVREQGIDVELVSLPGRPVDVLVEEAERLQARAVVVGTHGRTGLALGFLGSVAEGVLERCRRPVVIVPGEGEPEMHAP